MNLLLPIIAKAWITLSLVPGQDTAKKPTYHTLKNVVIVCHKNQAENFLPVNFCIVPTVTNTLDNPLPTSPNLFSRLNLNYNQIGCEVEKPIVSPSVGVSKVQGDYFPLILIDNIPFYGDISKIDTNSIHSIDIIQQENGSVLFEAAGSNGVISIITKRFHEKLSRKGLFTISELLENPPPKNSIYYDFLSQQRLPKKMTLEGVPLEFYNGHLEAKPLFGGFFR